MLVRIFILLCLLSLAGCGNKDAGIREITPESFSESTAKPDPAANESSVVESVENDALEGYTLIEAQTFEITLPSGAEAVFASYAPDDPGRGVLFQIERDGKVIQQLEGHSTLPDDEACFSQVEAVAFTDVNGDGIDDILVLCLYNDTEESGRPGDTHMAAYYLGNADDSFACEYDLCRTANLWLEEEYSIASLKRYAAKYYAPSDGIAGVYVYEGDGSTLSLSLNTDGTYAAELSLFRLTLIDDFAGKYENDVLTVTGTDAAGNPITAEITFADKQAAVTFTDSTWEYLGNGTQFVFSRE